MSMTSWPEVLARRPVRAPWFVALTVFVFVTRSQTATGSGAAIEETPAARAQPDTDIPEGRMVWIEGRLASVPVEAALSKIGMRVSIREGQDCGVGYLVLKEQDKFYLYLPAKKQVRMLSQEQQREPLRFFGLSSLDAVRAVTGVGVPGRDEALLAITVRREMPLDPDQFTIAKLIDRKCAP